MRPVKSTYVALVALVAFVAGQAEFGEGNTQRRARDFAKRAIRRSLLECVFVPVVDGEQLRGVHVVAALALKNLAYCGLQTFVHWISVP